MFLELLTKESSRFLKGNGQKTKVKQVDFKPNLDAFQNTSLTTVQEFQPGSQAGFDCDYAYELAQLLRTLCTSAPEISQLFLLRVKASFGLLTLSKSFAFTSQSDPNRAGERAREEALM